MCYTYDNLSRVIKNEITDLCCCTTTEETFDYDAAGNVNVNTVFEYDQNNKLISINEHPITYDMDGNMLQSYIDCADVLYTYDSSNRLTSAGNISYTYNAEDVRIRKTVGEHVTEYVYDINAKLSKLFVMTSNGVTTKYVYGLGLIGQECAGVYKTYHFDYRGSTTAITDITGVITDTFEYDTYGKLTDRTGTTNTPFLYNGRDGVITDENGLYYMRARYYCPEIKRFINADIVAGKISNAITLNRFAYADGNPVSNIDPFGLSAERGGPTPLEAAYMAQHIYEVNKDDQIDLLNDWVFSHLLVDDNGFRIGIYKKIYSDGTIAYAFVNKGTTTFNDWGDNILQPIGASSDMKRSISFAEQFVKDHPDAHITFIGHSKGGAEAAANAVATNRNAILFNPATVNLNAYKLRSKNYDANMTAYIVEGEILNKIFAPISKKIDDKEIIGKDSFWEKLIKQTAPGMMYDWYEAYIEHGMPKVISTLTAEGYK